MNNEEMARKKKKVKAIIPQQVMYGEIIASESFIKIGKPLLVFESFWIQLYVVRASMCPSVSIKKNMKKMKMLWFPEPTQVFNQGQWWSYLSTH